MYSSTKLATATQKVIYTALLRASQIPAGFCYQQLSIDDRGTPYCLHGFNGVYLSEVGWYRVDPRGNREGVDAQFTPPKEQLAYSTRLPGEADVQNILAEPLPVVVQTLQSCNTWNEVLRNPPDVSLESWKQYSLISKVMDYEIRTLTNEDDSVVWKMLMYASHESSLETVQKQPYLSRYAINLGRMGDMGFIASINEQSIGAAWLRLWSGDDRGFGYIDYSIPELAMAVIPEHRGQGIGTKLLMQVLESAQSAYPAVSLNVRANNPVVSLYQRAGFVKVEGSEVVNRTGGVSFNMVCRFSR